MRWAYVLAIAAVACKSAKDGTYFVADGHAANIAFDHVEFFFAASLDVNAFATAQSGAQIGDVYERRFVPADLAVPHASGDARRATYYVPTDGSDALGNYVLAIARDATGTPLGAGDATQFPVADPGTILDVVIPLESPTGVEIWGAGPSCAAWHRQHGRSWVGVVRGDDRDCDDVAAKLDCNDLAYCSAADGCISTPTLCTQPCAIGCPPNPVGNTCAPTLCLSPELCSPPPVAVTCTSITDLSARFACIEKLVGTHQDVNLPTQKPDDRPCASSFQVQLVNGYKCANPIIELAETLPDGYTFRVNSGGGAICEIEIEDPQSPQAFSGDHHLLISIDPDPAMPFGPRPTFLIGVLGIPYPDCSTPISTTNQLVINSCQ
jgi:hypothetical protein